MFFLVGWVECGTMVGEEGKAGEGWGEGLQVQTKKKKGVAGRWPRLCIIWGFELVFNF